MMLDELRRTAQTRGIATSFTDAGGRLYEVSEATLEAVLAAMGPTPERRDWPPVVVARQGWRHPWRPPAGEPATLELASGEERPLPAELPGDLPVGRHRVAGRTGATNLVVAPARCHLPASLEAGERAWGWAAQLYAVRSAASWGIGDLGDLAGLLASTASLGAGFALLNPLHAASPGEPSPYNPSTRVFRNPLYLRVEDVPELAALAGPERARVEVLASDGRDLNGHHRIDRTAIYRLKDEALRLAHGALDRLPERRAGLAAYRAAIPNLERFATFCAIQHAEGRDWRDWPAAYRHPGRPEVAEFGARHAGVRPAGGAERPGYRVRPGRVRRLVVPGRAGRRHDGRGPARPARAPRAGLGAAGVRSRPAGRGRLRAVRPDHPGRHGPRRRPAHRPRDGPVPAVLDPRGGRAGRGHLRPLPGRRPARRPGPGERRRRGPGGRRGPGHGRARGAGAAGGRGRALLPAGLVRARPGGRAPAGRRLPPPRPGRHHHPRPADGGRVLQRQRPRPPGRDRRRHPRRHRAGRPGGPAGEPVPAARGGRAAGTGRAGGGGARRRPLRLPRPHSGHAGRGHPRGRARGP